MRENEEREPNDELDTANEMPLGATIIGMHGKKGDRDYFRFPRLGKEGEVIEVRFHPAGDIPATLEVITSNLRLPYKPPAKLALPGRDKSFYVMVTSPTGSSADKAYTLVVERAQ